jgi:hypothetical protein
VSFDSVCQFELFLFIAPRMVQITFTFASAFLCVSQTSCPRPKNTLNLDSLAVIAIKKRFL